jgi:hypothetical protein
MKHSIIQLFVGLTLTCTTYLAELTSLNAPHGFILFSPHQALALDHLERFFGEHLGQTHED